MLARRVSHRIRTGVTLTVLAVLAAACGGGGAFDAQGLVFEYPPGFEEAEGTTRKILVLQSPRLEEGILTVLWEQGGQPSAGTLITTALAALGVDSEDYDDRTLDVIEFVDVPGSTAHYLEMTLRSSQQPGEPGYLARLLVLEGDNGIGYLAGHTVAAAHRDDAAVLGAWNHFRSSLRFETQNARN